MERHFEKNKFLTEQKIFHPALINTASKVAISNFVLSLADLDERNKTLMSLWNLIAVCEAALSSFDEDEVRESKVLASYELDPENDCIESSLSGGKSNG